MASSELTSTSGDGAFEHATSATTTAGQLSTEDQGRSSAPTDVAAADSLIQPSMSPTDAAAITASSTTAASATIIKATAKSLTSAAMVIGRAKKWKKKLKKLMLPLLLAYKMKFIALVPLLIGGLTLLVGSTGLAGFFFALFITVMSLKSGGNVSKSVVIKKDW